MEKTVILDGKEVRLKSTGAILLRYQMQFHRDALKDIFSLFDNIPLDKMDTGSMNTAEGLELISNMNVVIFQQLMWVMAKTADKTVPDFMEWLDSFEEFGVYDCLGDVMELLTGCLMTLKKKPNPMMKAKMNQ